MRTAICLLVSVCLVSSAQALNLTTDVDWFRFTGWSDATVTNAAGQDFNNIYPGVDVNVKVTGSLTYPTKTKGATEMIIISSHAVPGSNTFLFTLSSPLPLVINYQTVDSQEKLIVESTGSMSNTQLLGAPSMITPGLNSLEVMGTGTGTGAAGSSRGYVLVSAVSSFSVTHVGTRNNKFEAFRIGVPIPEPTGVGMAIVGLIPMMLRRRWINT